ncbi:glycyl-radical enzyme activating protein [Bacteroidota bacterium]
MKVCIFDIKRFAVHDGPGIRTTVFFKGCPLECWWCHNPEGINKDTECFTEELELDGVSLSKEVKVGRWIDVEELINELERDRVFMEESGGGISFSGGEPLQQAEALFRLLEMSGERNIHATVDTSGYTSEENIIKTASYADLILFDLKTMDDAKHRKFTGVSNQRILSNLEKALECTHEIIVRIPLVEGFNDSESEIGSMIEYLSSLDGLEAVDILPYHPFGTHKYRRFNRENRLSGLKKPSDKRLKEVRNAFSDAGFRVRTGG